MCRVALRQIHWYHSKISSHVINSLWCLQRIEHELSSGVCTYTCTYIYGILDHLTYVFIQRACGWPFSLCECAHRLTSIVLFFIWYRSYVSSPSLSSSSLLCQFDFRKKKSGQQPTTVCHFKWQNKHVALCDLLYFSRIFWVRLIELIGHVEMW